MAALARSARSVSTPSWLSTLSATNADLRCRLGMSHKITLPVAYLRASWRMRSQRSLRRLRSHVPSVVIGTSVALGVLGANGLLLSKFRNEPAMCVAHGEREVRSPHVGKTLCSSWDRPLTDPLSEMAEDLSTPSVPAIATPWSVKPGTMTTVHPRSHQCVYIDDAFEAGLTLR